MTSQTDDCSIEQILIGLKYKNSEIDIGVYVEKDQRCKGAYRGTDLGGAYVGKSDLSGKRCRAHNHTPQRSYFIVASGLGGLSCLCL